WSSDVCSSDLYWNNPIPIQQPVLARTILHGYHGQEWSAVFSPDGSRLVTTADDKVARLWKTASLAPSFQSPTRHTISLAFSADGKMLARGSGDFALELWDTAKKQPTQRASILPSAEKARLM